MRACARIVTLSCYRNKDHECSRSCTRKANRGGIALGPKAIWEIPDSRTQGPGRDENFAPFHIKTPHNGCAIRAADVRRDGYGPRYPQDRLYRPVVGRRRQRRRKRPEDLSVPRRRTECQGRHSRQEGRDRAVRQQDQPAGEPDPGAEGDRCRHSLSSPRATARRLPAR